MSVRFGLLSLLLFGAFLVSLAASNSSRVSAGLGHPFGDALPLLALVVGAFLAGACVVLLVMLLRDLTRSVRDYRLARRSRTAAETSSEGRAAQPAAAAGSDARAPMEASRPSHPAEGAGSDERTDALLARAETYRRAGRLADALATYREVIQRDRLHAYALRAIRELTASAGRWAEALEVQERLVALAGTEERQAELEWLAAIHYEVGKVCLAQRQFAEARRHFTEATRADRAFLPAHLALGDAFEQAGDRREAIRTWRRAAEMTPAPVLLRRLEQAYRAEGRPSLMVGLYQEALQRAPQDLALAFALGRACFELEMLDEAADQFQKVEVRAPELPALHAFLGAIYERRGQAPEAFEEYRKALRLTEGFEWPHRCAACGAAHTHWQDRCARCGRWNTLRTL